MAYLLDANVLIEGKKHVTHEKAGTSSKKIKIPDVCIGVWVRSMDPFTMLRIARARFVLDGMQ